jgi:indoleamine 2,3-dioxygenase
MALLSFLAQAYAAATDDSPAVVPANLAVPWDAVARRLDRRAEMSYASAVLHNWRRIDVDRPIEPGNLAVLHSFTGHGGDEAWFVIVQVAVESAAAGALGSLQPILRGAAKDDVAGVTRHLHALADALDAMFATLARLGERCDRYAWELRARRLYQPARMTLEQVPRGENPATPRAPDLFCRSTTMAAITALLRIDEELSTEPSWLPPAHAAFLQHVRRGADLRRLLERPGAPAEIRHAFNRCAAGVARFRAEMDDWLSDALLPVTTDGDSAVPGSPR